MERPVLVYDGDCGICTRAARLIVERLRPSAADFDVVASQATDLAALGLTEEEAMSAVQWVEPSGRRVSGHEAVAALLGASHAWARPAGRVITLPGVDRVAARTYRWVADNRHRFPGSSGACALPPTPQQPAARS